MTNNNHSENNVLEQLALDYMKEKKRKRRWGIFYKSIFVLLGLVIVFKLIPSGIVKVGKAHTALIDIQGPIYSFSRANADNLAESLNFAYEDSNVKGIILRINSPGGSAVQADYMFNEIMRQREKNPNIKVYAVCTEACSSAAYYIAAAADEIYAAPSSLIGAIGVLFNGFGFVDGIEKLGIERRLITAGKNKGFMDPFSPVNEEQEQVLRTMLDEVHVQFEKQVRIGRGDRLKQNDAIFSGLSWLGSEAKELGLIDGLGSPGYVAREIIEEGHIVDYTMKPNYFDKLGVGFGNALSLMLEKVSIGSTYGITSY